MRLTKIVCTLGPASSSPENILAMMRYGMNVARINFSHGSPETHKPTIQRVKEMNKKHGFSVALLLDTKGPEIRTGDVTTPTPVKKNQNVLFTSDKKATFNGPIVHVNYPAFAKDVKKAESILVDNGELMFTIVKFQGAGVILKSSQDGSIGNRRHVNLPGADVSLPAVTERDWEDLRFGIEQKMDYVALSFIRTAAEVKGVRKFLQKNKSDMRIVSKIETRKSVENIDEIIEASDAIMIARGDLGAELPFEKIPAIQDMIVMKCRKAGKPVIVATQMLESMIKNPMPTRAEVTDVAHAATTRTDSTMLSGETAAGKYPIQALEAMSSILVETESHLLEAKDIDAIDGDDDAARAQAAVAMAHSSGVPAIVVLSESGKTADYLSSFRPLVPIFSFSTSESLCRRQQLQYGIIPMHLITASKAGNITATEAMAALSKKKLIRKGQRVVVLYRALVGKKPIITVHLEEVA